LFQSEIIVATDKVSFLKDLVSSAIPNVILKLGDYDKAMEEITDRMIC